MSDPCTIIEMGSDLYLNLQKHRALMPEPSRLENFVIGQRFITVEPIFPNYDPSKEFDLDNISEQCENWEKVSVTEGEIKYYAWRHIPTMLIFR